ncbi:hypothetical protein D3C87_1657840 [compost metagenome]
MVLIASYFHCLGQVIVSHRVHFVQLQTFAEFPLGLIEFVHQVIQNAKIEQGIEMKIVLSLAAFLLGNVFEEILFSILVIP